MYGLAKNSFLYKGLVLFGINLINFSFYNANVFAGIFINNAFRWRGFDNGRSNVGGICFFSFCRLFLDMLFNCKYNPPDASAQNS